MIAKSIKKIDGIVLGLINLYDKKSYILDFLGWILYKISLDIGYVVYLYPFNGYMGYKKDFDFIKYVTFWIFLLMIFPLIRKLIMRCSISDLFVLVLSILYFVPLATFCSYNNVDILFRIGYMLFWFSLLVLQIYVPEYKPLLHINFPQKVFDLLIIVTILFVIFISYKYTGLRFYTGAVSIYAIRMEASNYIMPTLLRYIWEGIPIVVAVFLIYTLYQKKYIFSLVLLIEGYLVFSFACKKTIFFLFILVLAGVILWHDGIEHIIIWLGECISIVTVFEFVFLKTERIGGVIFRRNLFEQGLLASFLYDYFIKSPIDIYQQRFLRFMGLESAYNENIDKIIGLVYYADPNNNADSGLLGDAITNLGFPGFIILPLVIFLCFRLFEISSQGIDKRYLIGIVVYFVNAFKESTFSTVLLSHGFILACALLILFPRNRCVSEKNRRKNKWLLLREQ